MKQLSVLLATMACVVASSVVAENYSTEVTISPSKDTGTYVVNAVISEMVDNHGGQVEQVISRPRILTTPGVPASMYVGPAQKDPDYQSKDNINLDVTWPKAGDSGMAVCSVLIKRGDKVTSKFKFQLQVEGKPS